MVDVNIVDLGLVLKIIIDKFVKIPTVLLVNQVA